MRFSVKNEESDNLLLDKYNYSKFLCRKWQQDLIAILGEEIKEIGNMQLQSGLSSSKTVPPLCKLFLRLICKAVRSLVGFSLKTKDPIINCI